MRKTVVKPGLVVTQFRQVCHTGVILRDFSLEGSRAYYHNFQPDCTSASRKLLRELSMTPGIRGRHFKQSPYPRLNQVGLAKLGSQQSQLAALQRQQLLLDGQSAAVAGEFPIAADYAVTGDHNRNWIGSIG